ncbi:hypothetical protein B0H14DRAFT_1217662 [Mycena olivaceomarginata]|nr:hypothetical protein B0H14DRAFT_1217662 [Mycena olivaceomarginata]
MSAALPSSRALRRESAIIPTASVRRSPAVRASIPIPTRAPPPPPIVTSSAYCHSYTLAVTPAPPSASHLSPASASRPSRVSRTRAPPKTPLPTDALSTPWSGDWTAYAPFGTPSPSSSQHSYDSNSACSSSSERLAALLSPQRRFPAETQGVPSDVSSEWEEDKDEAWEACAVSYGDTYEDVPLSPLVACVPSSPSSPVPSSACLFSVFGRGGMELPALAPPAAQPRVRIGIGVLRLSGDSGPGAVHGLAPPPARVAVAVGVGGGASFSSCIPGPFPLYSRALFSLLRPGTRTAAVPTTTRTTRAPLPLVLLHALLRALRPRPRTPLPRRRVVAEDVRVCAGGGGAAVYALSQVALCLEAEAEADGERYRFEREWEWEGQGQRGEEADGGGCVCYLSCASSSRVARARAVTHYAYAYVRRQRPAPAVVVLLARLLFPRLAQWKREQRLGAQRLRLRERVQRGERGDAEEADPCGVVFAMIPDSFPPPARSLVFFLAFCDDRDTFLFFLVSCDATMAAHPLSFSFSVLTTRWILHAHSLYFYISNVSVPVPKHSL